MKPSDIDRFFSTLSEHWPIPTRIILIGGGAALCLGGTRPTEDLDYEIAFSSPDATIESFQSAVEQTQNTAPLPVQFSAAVERWSEVSFLDYRDHTIPYKRFGSIDVRLLEPAYWSIGKVSRYWDQDIQDLIDVFSRTRPDPADVASVWARALKHSPLSNTLFLVKKQARHFFTHHGKQIWGDAFDPSNALGLFD